MAVDISVLKPNFEWRYGLVYEDSKTNENFALVVLPDLYHFKHFCWKIPKAFSEYILYKRKNKMIFDVGDFFKIN